jgi:enoyl-CoA hydratase
MTPLIIEQRGGHTLATLSRPEARNAIDTTLVEHLHLLCERLERDPQTLVLTGSDWIFAAGAEIRQLRERGPCDALAGINSTVFDRIARLPMPTIAAIDGPAIGGGAELAYACDFRIATIRAYFANPKVNLGIAAAAGACYRLRELLGLAMATQILLGGRKLSAAEALAHGLIGELAETEQELQQATDRMVARIGAGSALAVRITKLALHAPAAAHPAVDNLAQAMWFGDAEKTFRMSAFLDRAKQAR